jgi:hypothetical protein
MLVDREQYMEEAIITCPLTHCGYRWCKSCSKEMPRSGNAHKHKCAPDKKVGARSCPGAFPLSLSFPIGTKKIFIDVLIGCGYQGRRVANDNYIQCRGVGCQLYVIHPSH